MVYGVKGPVEMPWEVGGGIQHLMIKSPAVSELVVRPCGLSTRVKLNNP